MADAMFPIAHLFSDIEGSTHLWESDAARMGVALAAHDELAHRVVVTHLGRVVKTTGDGFHAVFDDPVDAILAACAVQAGLSAVEQLSGLALRVRCGIHAGVGESRAGDYYGAAVNRAARIMSSAHGGQILVSRAVADLVNGRLGVAVTLRDLGRVRLRDLASPEHVFQADHGESRRIFPPLRGLDVTPHNLPVLESSFIGRVGAVADLAAALDSHRMVTITGPGGIGKTRLALQCAADLLGRFEDGAWVVELGPVVDPAIVPATLAQVLAVNAEPGKRLVESIASFLAKRNALLILDNCEHLVEACAELSNAVLRAAPGVRVLATSREPLQIAGEQVFVLGPLALPAPESTPDANDAARFPAVALFVERARERSGGFVMTDGNAPGVVTICRQLDGLPLAIELAAARVRMLGVDDIVARLGDRFRLLTGGQRTAAPRHQTLQRLVEWSYELLTDEERALFDRLGVFTGGFDLDAAEDVAAAAATELNGVLDMIGSLVEKSLVVAEVQDGADGARYRMLETLRAFALARLAQRPDAELTRERHARYFGQLAAAQPAERDSGPRGAHFARLDREIDNLRSALRWLIERPGAGGVAVELATAMTDFWQLRGHESEGARWVDEVLNLPCCARSSVSRARLLAEASTFATHQSRFDDARRFAQAALVDHRAHGTPSNVASSLQRLAEIEGRQGNLDLSQRLFEECLAIFGAAGDRVNEAKILLNLGVTFSLAEAWDKAQEFTQRAAAAGRSAGHLALQAYAEQSLAAIEIEQERLVPARAHYERVLSLASRIGDRYLATLGRAGLGQVDLAEGHVEQAHDTALAVLEFFVANEMTREITFVLDDIAHALAQRASYASAARLFASASKHRAVAGVSLSGTEQKRLNHRVADARTRGGSAIFTQCWAEGEALTLAEAVHLARAIPLPSSPQLPQPAPLSTDTRPRQGADGELRS